MMTPEHFANLQPLCRDEAAFEQLQQIFTETLQVSETAHQQAIAQLELQTQQLAKSALRERTIIHLATQLGQSITAQIRQPFDLDTILNITSYEVRHILEADRVAVYRFNPDWSGEFIAESVGDGWIKLVGPDVPQKVWEDTYLKETQGGRYRHQESFAIADVYTAGHMQCHIDLLEQFQAKAYAIAPILVGQDLWGLLAVYQNASARNWEPSEINLLTQMGTLLGVALQQAQLFRELYHEVEERRQAEQSLLQRETELSRVNHELKATNKELEAFSYSVSHDLRAPLRSIDGFSQALVEDYYDQLGTSGRDFLSRIRAATQRMGQLIDDLLTLSRITRQEMKRETVDLSSMARAIAAEIQHSQGDRHITFTIQNDLYAQGDPRLLHLALKNLFDNACKFTSKHAQAQIEFGSMLNQDGSLVFFVRDDGTGFDMAYADKLFGAFQRLHNLNDFPGTGIGLATVQRIVHRHGGQVWATAAIEQGATFYFTL